MESKVEIEQLLRKMMELSGKVVDASSTIKKSMRDSEEIKIQWKVCGVYGYQIFKKENYSYQVGEKLKNPDIFFVINNSNFAKRFLKGESVESGVLLFSYPYTKKWKHDEDLYRSFLAAFYTHIDQIQSLGQHKIKFGEKTILWQSVGSFSISYLLQCIVLKKPFFGNLLGHIRSTIYIEGICISQTKISKIF